METIKELNKRFEEYLNASISMSESLIYHVGRLNELLKEKRINDALIVITILKERIEEIQRITNEIDLIDTILSMLEEEKRE